MATKKQKRLAAQTKRAAFEAEERARGLEFQDKDRALREKKRAAKAAKEEEEAHKKASLEATAKLKAAAEATQKVQDQKAQNRAEAIAREPDVNLRVAGVIKQMKSPDVLAANPNWDQLDAAFSEKSDA